MVCKELSWYRLCPIVYYCLMKEEVSFREFYYIRISSRFKELWKHKCGNVGNIVYCAHAIYLTVYYLRITELQFVV